MKIGKNLRTFRANRGYTQEMLADLLGISQATYSKLENNERKIDLDLIQKIAVVYEVDMRELLIDNTHNKSVTNFNNDLENEKLIKHYEQHMLELKQMITELKNIITELNNKWSL